MRLPNKGDTRKVFNKFKEQGKVHFLRILGNGEFLKATESITLNLKLKFGGMLVKAILRKFVA